MNNGLEELDTLMETFYELCEDCDCNEDEYQRNNLTSPHHIIRKKLERLDKLEKVVEILKSKEVFEFKDDNCLYLNAEDHTWWGDIIEDSFVILSEEENELLEEVFGE